MRSGKPQTSCCHSSVFLPLLICVAEMCTLLHECDTRDIREPRLVCTGALDGARHAGPHVQVLGSQEVGGAAASKAAPSTITTCNMPLDTL